MTETYSVAGGGYDAHGNLLHMPHLHTMRWDEDDRLRMTQRQAVNPRTPTAYCNRANVPGTSTTPAGNGYAR